MISDLSTSSNNAENDEFLELISSCNNYVKIQEKLSRLLSDGIFQLAMARKSGKRICWEDCRNEMESNITVSINQGYDIEISSTSYAEENDPILLLSGLPPRALRLSQSKFIESFDEIANLAKLVNAINQICNNLTIDHK
jgi:hypothetical protein